MVEEIEAQRVSVISQGLQWSSSRIRWEACPWALQHHVVSINHHICSNCLLVLLCAYVLPIIQITSLYLNLHIYAYFNSPSMWFIFSPSLGPTNQLFIPSSLHCHSYYHFLNASPPSGTSFDTSSNLWTFWYSSDVFSLYFPCQSI